MQMRVNDIDLHYDEVGGGVPVLCLPAFPFDGRMWRAQEALGDVARLIIPDLRGTGRTTLTPAPYSMDGLADDMLRLLDGLGIERAVLMGVSLGNYIAFTLYERHPERVRGLVVADTRAEADSPETAERRRKTVEGLRADGTVVLVDRVKDLFAEVTKQERPALVQEMLGQAAEQRPEGLAGLTLAMACRPDRTALLPNILVPTLVICGADDRVSPPAGMRAMAAAIPGAHYVEIPRAGHLACIEQPGAFNQAVRAFVTNLPL